jgi:hypothetical protein
MPVFEAIEAVHGIESLRIRKNSTKPSYLGELNCVVPRLGNLDLSREL